MIFDYKDPFGCKTPFIAIWGQRFYPLRNEPYWYYYWNNRGTGSALLPVIYWGA